MVKLLVSSLVVSVGTLFTLLLNAAGVTAIPPQWVIGILVTLLIAVLTAMGAVIKIAYDTAKKWDNVLEGNGHEGFIESSREDREVLSSQNEQVYEQLLIQGRLLSELSYSFADIAKELDEHEDVEINVNLDRIERLREEKDDNDL